MRGEVVSMIKNIVKLVGISIIEEVEIFSIILLKSSLI